MVRDNSRQYGRNICLKIVDDDSTKTGTFNQYINHFFSKGRRVSVYLKLEGGICVYGTNFFKILKYQSSFWQWFYINGLLGVMDKVVCS